MSELYSFDNGKYIIQRDGRMVGVFLHEKYLMDKTGDPLILSMLDEIDSLKERYDSSIDTMIKVTDALIESRKRIKELEQQLRNEQELKNDH